MINKIKSKLKEKDIKVLMSNFSYLTIIELANYILPFVAIPYIVRIIGLEKYGVIMFSYAIMGYFMILTNYGFRLIATKYISVHRDDIKKLSRYYWTVISSQFLLLVISIIIFVLLLFNVEMFYQEKMVFIYAFGMIIGNIMFPIWFFQGMEDMKYISIFNVCSRLLYTASIFLFINDIDNYTLIPLINSVSYILVGVVSLVFIHMKFKIYFILPTIKDMKLLYIEGWHLFLSTIASNFYTVTNTVILGFLTNYTIVGVFSIAMMISGAVTKIIKIYSVVVYPHLAKYENNQEQLIKKAIIFLKLYSFILLIAALSVFLSAEIVIFIVFGPGNEESVLILQILAITILVEPFGSFFTSYLVIKNQYKTVSKITFYTMVVNFIIVFPMIYFFQAVGMASTKLMVESFQVFMNVKYNKELVFSSKKA